MGGGRTREGAGLGHPGVAHAEPSTRRRPQSQVHLDERGDLHRRHHLVRHLRAGSTTGAGRCKGPESYGVVKAHKGERMRRRRRTGARLRPLVDGGGTACALSRRGPHQARGWRPAAHAQLRAPQVWAGRCGQVLPGVWNPGLPPCFLCFPQPLTLSGQAEHQWSPPVIGPTI